MAQSDLPHVESSAVLRVASALHPQGSSQLSLCFGTEKKPILSHQTMVFVVRVQEADGSDQFWAVRIPTYNKSRGISPDFKSQLVHQEMQTLQRLASAGFQWSPRLIGGDKGYENAAGHPYLVVTWIHGIPLSEWSGSSTLSDAQRQLVIEQLLNIQLDLVRCTEIKEQDRSDLSFLLETTDSSIREALSSNSSSLNLRTCLEHRALLRCAVQEELNSSHFGLHHNQLSQHRIIVDSDMKVTGIIAWNLARDRPLQATLRWPELLATDREMIGAFGSETDGSTLLEDRQVAVSHLARLMGNSSAQTPESGNSTKSRLASIMHGIVSDPDYDWRHKIITACHDDTSIKRLAENQWFLKELSAQGAVLERVGGVNATRLDELVQSEARDFMKSAGEQNDGNTWEALLANAGLPT